MFFKDVWGVRGEQGVSYVRDVHGILSNSLLERVITS